jgi:YndJ-like protein
MNAVVPFFLLAPLFLVPFGFRLLGMATPGAEPPRLVHRAVLPAGLLLTLSFIAAPSVPAAMLSLPWLAVTAAVALAAGLRLLRDPARFRPGVRHATDAAVAFLAVGAAFATTDRLGARPLDFAPDVILLTAVHFHFAGFVLPLAGALAYGRRPTRWLELGLGAVVFGIPITALGFIGVPYANWVGAILTAAGGLGIGLTTLLMSPDLRPHRAGILAIVAGASLLVSMPMAVIYSTGVLIGATWLDLTTMARIHGGLNSLGFALPAILAWTFDRMARDGTGGRSKAAAASPQRRWRTGLLVGLVVGVGILVGGPMVGLIGIAAIALLVVEPGRDAPVGGLMSGFGAAWLALFLRADASCGADCVGPDLTAWYAIAGVMLLVGIALTIRTFRVGIMAGAG